MKQIQLWDWVTWNGSLFQVVELGPHSAVVESAVTHGRGRVPVAQLAEAIATTGLPEASSLGSIADLDRVSDSARRRAESIARTIDYVMSLSNPGTSTDQVTAVRERLATLGIVTSLRQTYRYLLQYRRDGIAGLIDRRTLNSARRRRVVPQLLGLIEDELKSQTEKSTGTRSRAIAHIRWEAAQRDIAIPSDRTLYRLLAELDRGRGSFGAATTRRSKAVRPDRTYAHKIASRPGELVEMDSTPLDVFVVMPDGAVGRPELTYAIDAATSTICGTLLVDGRAKSVDIAQLLLARMLTPLPRRAGWHRTLDTVRDILGPERSPTDEDWKRLAESTPLIVPETVTVDRGKVFIGSNISTALEHLHINQILANPRQGTDKPHVEGGFKRIRDGFIQYLSGYAGGTITNRGSFPESEAVWTLAEVQALLDVWVFSKWQTTPQSGLRLPGIPKRTLSPNQMYEALSAGAPSIPVGLTTDDYIALMPMRWRSIQPYGINFNGLVYDSVGLHPFRGRSSGVGGTAAGRWEIRFDPYDLTQIWVRDRVGDKWITASWTLAGLAEQPFSREVLQAARRAIADDPARPLNGLDLLAEVTRIQRARQVSRRAPVERPQVAPSASTRRPQLTVVPALPPSVGDESGAAPVTLLPLLD